MKLKFQLPLIQATLAIGLCSVLSNAYAQAVDVAAAEALLKDSKCTKCHAVASKKDGPALKEVVQKLKLMVLKRIMPSSKQKTLQQLKT
jgi:cytochrome c551/c552